VLPFVQNPFSVYLVRLTFVGVMLPLRLSNHFPFPSRLQVPFPQLTRFSRCENLCRLFPVAPAPPNRCSSFFFIVSPTPNSPRNFFPLLSNLPRQREHFPPLLTLCGCWIPKEGPHIVFQSMVSPSRMTSIFYPHGEAPL